MSDRELMAAHRADDKGRFDRLIALFERAKTLDAVGDRERFQDPEYRRALNGAWLLDVLMVDIDEAERFDVCQHCACPAEWQGAASAKPGEPKCPVCGARYDGPRRRADSVLLHAGISHSEGERRRD